MRQPHAAQHVRRFGELNIVVGDDLEAIAPGVAEVEERPRQHLTPASARLTDSLLVIHHQPEVATVIRRLTTTLLKREELVAKVDERHAFAFTAKLKIKDPGVERQRFLYIAHFQRDVIKTHGACSFNFGHKTL